MTFEEENYVFDLDRRITDLEIDRDKVIGSRNKNIEAVLDDFEEMRNQICNGGVQFRFETPESFDRLTVELLKVVELKKIASILAEKE